MRSESRKQAVPSRQSTTQNQGVEGELMSMKKIGLAAGVMLFAVSAMASNFRAADQVYVPAAGKIGTFASDVYVSNPNAFPVTVSVTYSQGPAGAQSNFPNLFTLAANERREFVDFI